MEVPQSGFDHASAKVPGHQIVNLDSDDNSSTNDALLTVQRVNGVNRLEALGDSEQSDEDDEGETGEWELDSRFEDTIEELGDEGLLGNGKYSETPSPE